MNELKLQIEKDVADFSRRVNERWPNEVKGWDEKSVETSVVKLATQRQEQTIPVREIVLKSPNSNAQGVG